MSEKKEAVAQSASRRKRETKSRGFYMRMTPSELSELDMLSYVCEESKTEIMKKAFRQFYEQNKDKF